MPTESEQRAIDVIRRWCDEAWSRGNLLVADELIDPHFKVHGAGGQVVEPGIEGLKQLVSAWRTGFPDGEQRIEDIWAERDTVIVRLTWRGTHRGPFMGVAPTGRRVEIQTLGIDRVVDGKVVEGYGELDLLGLFRQIGAIPVPVRPGQGR